MASVRFADLQFPHRVPGFRQPASRRVSAADSALGGGVPSADGRLAPRWETQTARRVSVYQHCPLPTPEDRLVFILAYLDLCALGGARATLRYRS